MTAQHKELAPDDYPSWFDVAAGVSRQPNPVGIAIDGYLGSLSDDEFDALVSRTRGARR